MDVMTVGAEDLLLLLQRCLQRQQPIRADSSHFAGWFHRSGSQSSLRQHVGRSSAGAQSDQ